jgi:Wzt C-terminal domain
VEEYCHRAMLISDGQIQYVGDPAEVGRRYTRLNFEQGSDVGGAPTSEGDEVRLLDAWLEDEAGERIENVEQGTPIRIRVELEARRDSPGVGVGFILANADGVGVFQFGTEAIRTPEGPPDLAAGRRVRIEVEIENPLNAGRYFLHCGVNRVGGGVALYVHNALDFVVFGGDQHSLGVVSLPHEISATVAPQGSGR